MIKTKEKLDFRLVILKGTLRSQIIDLINKIERKNIDLLVAQNFLKRMATEINAGIPRAKDKEFISEFFRVSDLAQNLNGITLEHINYILIQILKDIDIEATNEGWI